MARFGIPARIIAAAGALAAKAVLLAADLPPPVESAVAGSGQVRLRTELFRRFDTDRDHRFSDREVKEMTATMMREGRWTTADAARETALARFDHDVDGRLDVAERREKLHALLADGARADTPGHRAAMARYDRNRNGTLEPMELLEIEAQLEARIATQDSDGNGILDAREIQAARKAELKRRGRRLPATTEQEQRGHNEDFWRIIGMGPDASSPRRP